MTELLIPSAWINSCSRINLILIASLAVLGVLTSLNSQRWAYSTKVCWYCLVTDYRNQHQVDKLCGKIIGIYLISYICLNRFLLALNFVFSKTNILKLLFIIFAIKQLLGNAQLSGTNIYSAKQSITLRGKAEWW